MARAAQVANPANSGRGPVPGIRADVLGEECRELQRGQEGAAGSGAAGGAASRAALSSAYCSCMQMVPGGLQAALPTTHTGPLNMHAPALQPAACLGFAWWQALALGAATAAALAAARLLLGVQAESLIYIRLLGLRLATHRRCGLWCSSRFLPLRTVQSIILHEVGADVNRVSGANGMPDGRWGKAPR